MNPFRFPKIWQMLIVCGLVVAGLALLSPFAVDAQTPPDIIVGVAPPSAHQGDAGVLVTITLTSETPPTPPQNAPLLDAVIGASHAVTLNRVALTTVTTVFNFAPNAPTGRQDLRLTFQKPDGTSNTFTETQAFEILASSEPPQDEGFTITQTLSDGGQRNTIAFDGLAFLTGNLGADSFFPPGKVADFWGFQYLRDNDPTEMGHNTDFLTSAALNMLYVLTPTQRAELIALAESQVDDISQYGMDRFVLMQAFRRLLAGDIPAGSTGLDMAAVQDYSAELYRLDGEISYARAQVMGAQISAFTTEQRAYLDALKGQGMATWPNVEEPEELRGLSQPVKVAVMTYAGDMFSWYVGNLEADVYFCPERQGTYFGSFYMKDAPAVGNPGYSIPTTLTAEMGEAFLQVLTPEQAALVTDLVTDQKPALYAIVDQREDVAVLLRQFMAGGTPPTATVKSLMEAYGALDGEIVYRYAMAFAQVSHSLTETQQAELDALRLQILGTEFLFPAGAFLYAEPISIPVIPNTDFLFAVPSTHKIYLPLVLK